MQMSEKQYLSRKNLLSFKTRVASDRLYKMIFHLIQSTELLNLKVTDDIIFTIKENILLESSSILDTEFLIPINSEFESSEHYIFKPEFRIENALKFRYFGSDAGLIAESIEIKNYLLQNNFNIITDFYYVFKGKIPDKSDNCYPIDTYVGLNGNIV